MASLGALLTFSAVLNIVHGQQIPPYIAQQSSNGSWLFHHKAYHNSIVVRNGGEPYLYIDGGELTVWNGQGNGWDRDDGTHGTGNISRFAGRIRMRLSPSPELTKWLDKKDSGTYAIALDRSWTLADTPIEYLDDHPDSSYTSAALWPSADGTSFYSYSGGASGAVLLEGWPSEDNRLVHVTPAGSNITREYVAPPPESNFSVLTRAMDGLYAAGNGLGFAMGGYQYPFTDYDYQGDAYDISGLVMYNDSTQEWWNISTTAYSSTGTAREGVAHFVPKFGPAGLLFVFGGYANGQPTPFDDAYMFEPLSQQWRKQQVTGTIPPPVSKPCMVGLAGDNGTYEIFLHGGWTAEWETEGSIALGAVYSFSLPAFNWQIHSTNSTYSRVRHSCNVAGNRQMIVVGGQVSTLESTLDYLIRDPWPRGIGVYDLAALEWRDSFDAEAAPYVTPDVIKAAYLANGTFPSAWTEEDVQEWFVKSANGSRTTDIGDDKDSNGAPAGAIAGGVVGGLVVLAIIAAIIWFVRRRARRPFERGNADEQLKYPEAGLSDEQRARQELDGRNTELPGAKARQEMSGESLPVEIGTSQVQGKPTP